MSNYVAHFVRKDTQLKATFIQNQILGHKSYKPIIIFKYKSSEDDGGYAEFDRIDIPMLNLWDESDLKAKILYDYFKIITQQDVNRINNLLQQYCVKILHFHYGTDAGLYSKLLRQSKYPSIVSFYGYDSSYFPSALFGFGKVYLNQRVFPYVTRILAMSDDMKQDLVKIGAPPDRVCVHYFGNDIECFLIKRHYVKRQRIIFLILASLVPKKGHIFLLEAFKRAFKINRNIELIIIGTGPLRGVIENYIKAHDMHYVKMEGKVKYCSEKHFNMLNEADVFIHPSITDKSGNKEGIPGAIVEAMASGLPVISTYHAGIPSVIKDYQTGILVKEWAVESLTAQILLLADRHDLREKIGQAAQKYAIENCNLHLKTEELEKIYNFIS